MRYTLESEHPLTDEACRAATGKTFAQWYSELDAQDALKLGRRKATWWMYEQGFKDDWWRTTVEVEYERARGQVKKDGLTEGYGICSTKTVAAPLADVYRAWITPATLSEWFGSATQAQVQDGGSYSNAEGDAGKYLRVREGKDLRFTWENPAFSSRSLVDVVFEDKGKGKTGLMVNHSRIQTRPEADGLRAAWGEALGRLKALLEA